MHTSLANRTAPLHLANLVIQDTAAEYFLSRHNISVAHEVSPQHFDAAQMIIQMSPMVLNAANIQLSMFGGNWGPTN